MRSGSHSGGLFLLFTTGHPSGGMLCSPYRETVESSLAVIHSSSEAKGRAGYGDITQTPTGGGTVAMEPFHPRKQAVGSCKSALLPLISNQVDLFLHLH